jgi:hypothetical protein
MLRGVGRFLDSVGAMARNRYSSIRPYAELVVGVASLHPRDSSETHAKAHRCPPARTTVAASLQW